MGKRVDLTIVCTYMTCVSVPAGGFDNNYCSLKLH